MSFVEELVPHLPEWLGRQRWFGAKGREVSVVDVVSATSLTDTEPLLDLLVLAVSFADGGPAQHYQLLLGRRQEARGELEHVTIGRVGGLCAYDALWDHTASAWLLEAVRAGRTIGAVRFVARGGRHARAARAGPGDGRRAVQHVGGVRRAHDHEAVPAAQPGREPGPGAAPGAAVGGQQRGRRAPGGRRGHARGRVDDAGHAAGLRRQLRRRLGDGARLGPRPVRRGGPARGRGRRRLRGRGGADRRDRRHRARQAGRGAGHRRAGSGRARRARGAHAWTPPRATRPSSRRTSTPCAPSTTRWPGCPTRSSPTACTATCTWASCCAPPTAG